jgi:hypothetical protein
MASKAALRSSPGEVLEVSGSLRRRFWRTGTGIPTSRYEVDVVSARKAKGGAMTKPTVTKSKGTKSAAVSA